MDPALAPGTSSKPIVFQDGLGERRRISDVSGADTIEQLCLRSELTAIPSFEFALRERASRLAHFRHLYYGRVRSVDRLTDPASTLTIVSDATKGVRLANLLTASGRRPITLDINASLHLIRQLVAAVAMLHETARDAAHGALGPERIIVTPNARIVIVEYVLGAALEQLRFSQQRYWKELRVALPASAALPHFDHRADVTQIGVVALSLVIGRLLHDDEYPAGAGDVLALASAISPAGERQALPEGIRTWIGRALQLDARHSFSNALEARDELDRVLAGEDDDVERSAAVPRAASGSVAPAPAEKAAGPDPAAPEPGAPSLPSAPPVALFAASSTILNPSARQTPAAADVDDGTDGGDHEARGFGRLFARPRIAGAAAIVVLAMGGFAGRSYFSPRATIAPTGALSVNSNPPGAEVLVDGQSSGVTPVTLTLAPGGHVLELRGEGEPRSMPVTIVAGTQVSQYIELPKGLTAFGQLQIRTEPAGAQVTVDGIPRGRSPVLIESLAAGEHAVSLDSDVANVRQTVTVEAGQTAALVVPLGAADNAPVSGWMSVAAPVELQLFENKRLLGTSQSDRLMVSAGKHEIELVNEPLGYRVVRTIQVTPGKVTPIKVEWPRGTVSINAQPWADVFIDGERIGETPIGNLQLPIGPHEIVFRHPELGEQKYATTVSLREPSRVSVDMRRK